MEIEVRLYATLRAAAPAAPAGVLRQEAAPGATVLDVLAALGIAPQQVHLVMVNGAQRGLEQVLAPGDRLGLFPPVGGG